MPPPPHQWNPSRVSCRVTVLCCRVLQRRRMQDMAASLRAIFQLDDTRTTQPHSPRGRLKGESQECKARLLRKSQRAAAMSQTPSTFSEFSSHGARDREQWAQDGRAPRGGAAIGSPVCGGRGRQWAVSLSPLPQDVRLPFVGRGRGGRGAEVITARPGDACTPGDLCVSCISYGPRQPGRLMRVMRLTPNAPDT